MYGKKYYTEENTENLKPKQKEKIQTIVEKTQILGKKHNKIFATRDTK